ncbi:MAG: formate hydrogenlyase [Gammaproteobacteria bacterium]|nr:formate hydrogenlyase [Gammaproteobacteria bacterium]
MLAVPCLPLLLAFPALRSRLTWPCHIALLPVLILVVIPVDISIDLPWLLLGTGLAIDNASRMLLVMSLLLWAVAATLLHRSKKRPEDGYRATFFLLTLAGNLGAILATDLVSFFALSTLMGYGFFGLLVTAGGKGSKRATRVYLAFLILADLALFEALLIAAATSDGDLGFAAVRQTMAESPSSGLYLLMVLTAFAAKAAIWPLHVWLPLAFRAAQPGVALLLGTVPVAIGLLGLVRWLPLGEIALPGLGLIIQGLGIAAVLYAILAGVKQAQIKMLPAYASIVATGLYLTALGVGLADPVMWDRYGYLAHYFIVFLGLGLAALTAGIGWLEARKPFSVAPEKQEDNSTQWFERWPGALLCWGKQMGFNTLPQLRAAWLAKVGQLWQFRVWQKMLADSEYSLQHWTVAITLFLLLAIVITFIAK